MTDFVAPLVDFLVETAVDQTRWLGLISTRVVVALCWKEVIHLGVPHHVGPALFHKVAGGTTLRWRILIVYQDFSFRLLTI